MYQYLRADIDCLDRCGLDTNGSESSMGSYYSIDAILTDGQKVPCIFDLDIPGLGYLDENPGGDVPFLSSISHMTTTDNNPQIKSGSRVSLPLWLSTLIAVQRLGSSQRPLCALDLPPAISPRVLNALKADAKTVDLRGLAAHFYELATRVLELFEEEEIVDVLTEVRPSAHIRPHPLWFKSLC